MSGFVKFFTKKKNSSNKENDASLKRVNFERASTRSEVGGTDAQQRERDRQAMRAIPNPYSVWTEPKKTRGPSSCPGGVSRDSAYYNERRSVRAPKQERAGSVYGGDISGLRQYRIDGPSPDGGGSDGGGGRRSSSSTTGGRSSHHQSFNGSHSSYGGHRAPSSRRYAAELSMIEERSERSDRSMHERSHHDWTRSSSHRRPPPPTYDDYTSGDSDDYDETVRRLEHKIAKLKDERNRYRNQLDHKKSELEYAQYQLTQTEKQLEIQINRAGELANELKQCERTMNKMQAQLASERRENEELSRRLSQMTTSATSDGAMERLVSSSETSLEMDEGEGRGEDREEEREGGDEVRNFRASDSAVTTSGAGGRGSIVGSSSTTAAAAPGGGAPSTAPSSSSSSPLEAAEEMELPRGGMTPSPMFELRRSFSDMGPGVSLMMDGAGEEMAEGGGSWRRRERRRSFVKRSLLPPTQESESSDGEKILLMERQVRKKGGVVKYDPNKRVPVKEKHYRRFGKPERSALDGFTFLEQEITDVSGMLSSPSEGNY